MSHVLEQQPEIINQRVQGITDEFFQVLASPLGHPNGPLPSTPLPRHLPTSSKMMGKESIEKAVMTYPHSGPMSAEAFSAFLAEQDHYVPNAGPDTSGAPGLERIGKVCFRSAIL